MFQREWTAIPEDSAFPADMEALGFTINDQGQFVEKKTGQYFKFFKTNSDRANDVLREAMHDAAGKELKQELAKYEVLHYYVTGENGTVVEEKKPLSPYITILATDEKELRKKTDVVIIVPERNQDLGVWAYRELMNNGGLDRGSVLGLVKRLQDMNLQGTKKVCREPCTVTRENLADDADVTLAAEAQRSRRTLPKW